MTERTCVMCYSAASFFIFLFLVVNTNADPGLPRLKLQTGVTVSGVSSGGAFAIQYHVAHSEHVKGAGIFAGPPYWCAQANVDVALSACMTDPDLIEVPALIEETEYAAVLDSIDPTKHLSESKVWLFTGQKDTVVVSGVMEKTQKYYAHFLPDSNIQFITNVSAEHSWVTDNYGNDCPFLGDPYINNCKFDATGSMLNFVLGQRMSPRKPSISSNLLRFDQSLYIFDAPALISMGTSGYVYVPTACQGTNVTTPCQLHVAFHGCNQDLATIGTTFVEKTGLNEYAEANSIVVLYPQAIKSPEIPYNPKGCWDWWGYSGEDYGTQLGPQILAVRKMITALSGEE